MLNFFFLKKQYSIPFIKNFLHKYVSSLNNLYAYLFRFCVKKRGLFFKKNIGILTFGKFKNTYFPENRNGGCQYRLNLFRLYIKNSWFTYRHFFGYSKFAKTRNNNKSSKKNSMFFKNFIYKYIYCRKVNAFTKNNVSLMLHVEFFNKLWFFQWFSEWKIARGVFLVAFWTTKKKKIKFGTYFSLKSRPYNFILKTVKRNRKKVKFPKDTFNIGFFFGFSKKMKRLVMSGKSIK